MTTLGPDHFGHNIQMVIKTKAAITAPESTPTAPESKPQEVQIPSNSLFNRSNSVTLAVTSSREKRTCNIMRRQKGLEEFKEKSKGNSVTVSNRTTRKTFLLFCLKTAYYQKCVPYIPTMENAKLPWVCVTNKQST